MLSLLRDPETTNIVLEFILDIPNGRRALGRLARTCKAISEPTLNVLWKELDSLNPLLYTMPSNLFKRARRPGLGFATMPQDSDWKRLIKYAPRVRRLAYNETAGNVHPSIFSVIEEYSPDNYILPNLRSLSWRAETPDGLERSFIFLNPDIQSLTIDIGSRVPQADVEEFLNEATASTRLSEISITSSARLPDDIPEILRSQGSLQKVALLAPGALSPTVGSWLSGMPHLRTMQLDITGRTDSAISAFFDQAYTSDSSSPGVRTPDSGVFSGDEMDSLAWSRAESEKPVMLDMAAWQGYSQLRNLKLTGEATSMVTFLSRMASPIQQLELVIDDPEEEAGWQDLCLTIHRRFRNSLQSLQVTATGSSRFSDLVRSTTRGDVACRRLPLDCLRSLPHLLRLDIDLPESIILYDTDMYHLAAACPNLEILRLCSSSRWPVAFGPPKLTLAGLAPLTASCRQLHTLAIPVNAVEAYDDRIYDWEMSSRSLLRLNMGHSWIEDSLQATILLSHLAPCLETLRWYHEKNRPGYIEANSTGWQKVNDTLPHLQRLRLLERYQVPMPVTPVVAPTSEKSVDATVSITTAEAGVHAKPLTTECAVSAIPSVVHASIEAKPMLCSQEVDATPEVNHQEVDAVVVFEPLEFEEKARATVLGSVGGTVRSFYHAVRSVSPPILLRLIDIFSIFSPASSSPMLSKISPVCQ